MNMKIFKWITSIIVLILALYASIYYWYLICIGWSIGIYATIGAFIAIHFALFGIIVWQYLEYKQLRFVEWWDKVFKNK